MSGTGQERFRDPRWNRVRKPQRQDDLKNVYRVLRTRARQWMVIVVPEGDLEVATAAVFWFFAVL